MADQQVQYGSEDSVEDGPADGRTESEWFRMLSGFGDFQEQLERITELLLDITGISRATIFENEDDPADGLCMTQICEVCAGGVEPWIGNPAVRRLPYEIGVSSLLSRLQSREPWAQLVSELEGTEREMLEARGILSMLIAPVFSGDTLWGFIGVDDGKTPRQWREEDGQILEAVADAIGIEALRRQQVREIDRRIGFERLIAVACSQEQSAQRLGLVIEGSGMGTWEWNVQTNETVFNEQWAAMLGYTLEELAPTNIETWEALTHPDDLKKAEALLAPCLAGERLDYTCELRMKHKDGHWVWIHDRGRVMTRDGAGKPLAMFGTHMDITERKQAESALRESEVNFRHFFESMTDIVLVATPAGRVLFANQATRVKLGYSEDELAAMHLLDLHSPEERDEAEAIFAAILRGQRNYCPLPLAAKDGTILPVETRVWFGKWSGQNCVFGICKDLRAQQEAQQRFEHIFRSNPSPMALSSVSDRRFLDINDAFVETTGYPREEIIGKTVAELGLIIDPQRHNALAESLRASGRISSQEQQVRCKDGTLREGLFSGEVIRSEGRECFLTVMIDITDRKRAEEALRESEEKHRALVDGLPDIVMRFDREGRHLFVSDNVREMVDLEAARFIGKTHAELDFPEELCRFWEASIRRVFDSGVPYESEFPFEGKGGHCIVNWRLVPERDTQGAVASVLSISRNITARRKAEKEYQTLFREMLDGFALHEIICDEAGTPTDYRFLSVNPAFERMTGLKAESIVGRTVLEVMPGTEHYWIQLYGNVALTGEPVVFQHHAVEVGKHFEGTAYRPAPGQFACIFQDITPRKRAEEALKASEEQHRLLIQHLHAAVVVHAADTQIILANEQASKLLGLSLDQMTGKTTLDPAWHFVREDETVMPFEEYPVQRVLATRQPLCDFMMSVDRPATEDRIWLLVNAFPELDADGRLCQVVVTFIDISERKRIEAERLEMERRLQHAQKLESLGVLAGGIAHDFNNLLMAILGHADLALDELTPTSPARANIRQIETASRRAADLCAQMLAYSGRGHFIIETFDVSTLIEEMAHLLKTSISKKAILDLRLEKNLPKVEGDATQIRQVIMNLVINASEAIGERGGVISASTGTCHCRAADFQGAGYEGEPAAGLYTYIEVADTGCGMDQATLDRLFEPFFTTKFTGRGLGMSAVQGIVRGHKGILTVNSEEGKGTAFRILLPPATTQDRNGPDIARDSDDARIPNGRILLVDDEESIRTLGQKMLERIGFQVITASDGREALAVYGRERGAIDLVVLDLAMPHMDGEETLRELRRLDPGAKIVMSSGYSNHEIEARMAGEGLLGFIQKPYTIAQLKERLYPHFEQ